MNRKKENEKNMDEAMKSVEKILYWSVWCFMLLYFFSPHTNLWPAKGNPRNAEAFEVVPYSHYEFSIINSNWIHVSFGANSSKLKQNK